MSTRATLLFAWLLALSFVLQGAAFASGVACAHASTAVQAGLDISPDPHAHHRGHAAEASPDIESPQAAPAVMAGLCDCGCACASNCLTPCASALATMPPATPADWAQPRLHPAGAPTDVVSPPPTVPLRPPIFV